MYMVVLIRNNCICEITYFGPDQEVAEANLIATCAASLSNWDEYTAEDVALILSTGYEKFGNGRVELVEMAEVYAGEDFLSWVMDLYQRVMERKASTE